MTPLPLLLLAAAVPASAVRVPEHEDPAAVLERSRRDPSRLHALIVSATWCHACRNLKTRLEAYQPSTGPVAAAAWAMTETDRLPEKALARLLRDKGGTAGDTLPSVLVLRGGRPLGYSTVGADLGGIERFLGDAAARPDETAASRPLLACPGRRDWASYTLGVSGYLSEENRATDWFGREVLVAFRGEESRSPALLLAPARASSTTLAASPSGNGVFFAPDATLAFEDSFGPVEESTRAIARLADAPGDHVRLILTGHGAPEGMTVAYKPNELFAGFKTQERLDEPQVSSAVAAARRAGKEMRALVTACYGGQYARAFMPLRRAAPACGAFATLPEKTAEGCYSDAAAKREDYVAAAARALSCPQTPGSSRARHYRAAAESSGRDVPMLTSEYFLLYGPGAAYLGRGERQPAPPGGLLLQRFDGDVEVVFDLVGGGVVAAHRGGRPLPPPRVSVIDCRETIDLSGLPPNFFHLRSSSVGPRGRKSAPCTPEVALDWRGTGPGAPPRRTALLSTQPFMEEGAVLYEPTASFQWTRERSLKFAAGLPDGATVDARGLKPEARAWLAAVLPRFSRPLTGAALVRELLALADEIRPRDPDLAGALAALTERVRIQARKAKTERRRRDAGDRKAPPEEDQDDEFTADELLKAMLRNLGPWEIREDGVALARLAHLAAVAAAETSLREQARGSREARDLLAQLAALKLCERDVLD